MRIDRFDLFQTKSLHAIGTKLRMSPGHISGCSVNKGCFNRSNMTLAQDEHEDRSDRT